MEFFNVFRGLKKSNSDSKLVRGNRFRFNHKTKHPTGAKSIVNSPLPPRPSKGSVAGKTNRHGRVYDNIPEDIVCGPSLHIPPHATGQVGNSICQAHLLIIGSERSICQYRIDTSILNEKYAQSQMSALIKGNSCYIC